MLSIFLVIICLHKNQTDEVMRFKAVSLFLSLSLYGLWIWIRESLSFEGTTCLGNLFPISCNIKQGFLNKTG